MSDSPADGRTLVEKRLRHLERQRQRQAPAGAASEPLGSGPPNAHGKPQVPVGQRVVENWPVLDLGVRPRISRAEWQLEVAGEVEDPQVLDWEALQALPQRELTADFHCVTTWSRLDNRFGGVLVRDLAAAVRPTERATHLLCTGADRDPHSGEPYTTNLPLEDALQEDVMLVHSWDGEPLPPEHGGPVRMVTPRLYAWKGAKWIVRMDFLDHDEPGFWERRGYSNTGDPWRNDRYAR